MQHMLTPCLLTPAGLATQKCVVFVRSNHATMAVRVSPDKLEAVEPQSKPVHARADTMMMGVVADGKMVGRRWLDCGRRACFHLVGHAMPFLIHTVHGPLCPSKDALRGKHAKTRVDPYLWSHAEPSICFTTALSIVRSCPSFPFVSSVAASHLG
jgi:hypothetical protein